MENYTKPIKPMLAVNTILSDLRFPLLASPKLDGGRAVIQNGQVLSRSGKTGSDISLSNWHRGTLPMKKL